MTEQIIGGNENMRFEKVSNVLLKVSEVLQRNKYVSAISNGLMATMPILMVGAIGSILNSLGISAWQTFLENTGLKTIMSLPAEVGTNMLAIFAVFAIGYNFAKSNGKDGLTAGVMALMAFMFVTPLQFDETLGTASAIPMSWLGASGLFTAMIVGLVSARIYCLFIDKNITIKMPDGVPPIVSRSFGAILPGLCVGILSLAAAYIFSLTSWESIHGFIYEIVAKPLTGLGGTFPALLIAVFCTQLFWAVGIHGTMVALSVFMPIWAALDAENLAAFSAGADVPHIVCMQFFFLCAFAGGAGNTIGLIINMFFSKNKANKALAELAIVPGLFGINEPIIFGMPIVLNPLIIVPFILSPLVTTILGYAACSLGLIAGPTGISSIAGAPIIVNQFIMGGWTWAVWELLVIVISFLIYMPFFKLYEKKQMEEMTEEEQNETVEKIGKSFEKATK